MKKRLFAILVSVSLLSTMVLSGCGQNSTDEKVTSGVIRIAYNNIENYPHYKGLERAAQEIEDRSDGRFTVKIYSNGTLGDQRAALELTQNNAVQMCVANATMVESYNHDFSVLSMPYLFEDSDHQREAYTNGMLDELFDSTEEYDFKIVGAFGSGSRNIFCEKAVRTPEDLKGLKIRVMQSDNMVKMLQLMGGTGVPMSASEQYSAMQQGRMLVEAQILRSKERIHDVRGQTRLVDDGAVLLADKRGDVIAVLIVAVAYHNALKYLPQWNS